MLTFSRLLLCASLLVWIASCSSLRNATPTQELKQNQSAWPKTDTFLLHLLQQHPNDFDTLLRHNDRWKIRIIYTQIDRQKRNAPRLKHFYFNLDPRDYFYPASTVKLPAALLALQKLNERKMAGLDKNTTMISESGGPGLPPLFNDPSSGDGRPTVAQYIKKIFLVSDNEAYNRLYEFLGQEYLNNTLHHMGYDSVQLLHRLQVSLSEEQNRTTNPVRFYDTAANVVFEQPLQHSALVYQKRQDRMGTGFISAGQLVQKPFDFSQKNRFPLADLHSVLQSVLFPRSVPAKQRFRLTGDDYRFVWTCMSMKPKESRFPQYDSRYSDAYVKFLLYGGQGPISNPSIRVFNKVGDAYGFLQDVAYVVDFDKGVEFMLSASIYCNSDGIFNDDKYDYDTVGFPFLKHLGEAIYQYEVQRKKKRLPDLSGFRMNYTDSSGRQ
ncbi:serine hydrolase [Flavisolibacter nicotianae]|uniref:serine hydrolase n=1 Tax=Flavisolibacter nicotianae TaxID=2364882 RepID=UPI000EB3C155|nr:serine hydrolase [Flavisolibacter nicotianae]